MGPLIPKNLHDYRKALYHSHINCSLLAWISPGFVSWREYRRIERKTFIVLSVSIAAIFVHSYSCPGLDYSHAVEC